jgi:cellulose synthase (UDP-forming)
MTESHFEQTNFLNATVDRGIIVFAWILTCVYFFLIAFTFEIGSSILFTLLILGEMFHVFQITMYLATIWDMDYEAPKDTRFSAPVDVFITVAGEPVEIVEETVRAARAMDYPAFRVHILNDGYVAKKENWREIEELAARLDVSCITRKVAGGAKAGNINNAVKETHSPFIVIFDADHVPHPDFLKKTMPYFVDDAVGFVQSPQFYKNYAMNYVTRSAWEQQQLFFGPICRGKNRWNATTMCGTNMVIRRTALYEVGGIAESIAEDFLTGALIHGRGYKSVYVPEVLAEGLAPEDFLSYYKQQFRWARGSLDVIFPKNILLSKGLTSKQRLQYASSISFYFSGLIVAMNALIPIVFFFTSHVPIVSSTMLLASIFLPYIFLTLFILQKSSNFSFTFRALTFSMGQFNIHCRALWSAFTRQKVTFSITPKTAQRGNFIKFVMPHIAYIFIAIAGMAYALHLHGLTAAFIANCAWALTNVGVFLPMIYAAWPKSEVQRYGVLEKRLTQDGIRIKSVPANTI